jgi:hypothetical protein
MQSASILSNHSNHSSPAKKEIKNELNSNNKISKYQINDYINNDVSRNNS